MKLISLKILSVLFLVFILTGCLFPKNELAENQVPYEDQLDLVQVAVEKYQEETGGLLPIKTKSADVPIFEKYIVDFDLLKEKNLISSIPGNAFEKGGVYQYTLISVEDDPRVKLIDLRITDEIQRVYVKLDQYRQKNTFPPFGEMIEKDIYSINYEALGLKEKPYVVSPFTNENLPLIMDSEGQLYVDYRIDLMDALEKYDHDFEKDEDIRLLLAENTPFVPVYSLPYSIENDEPVFLDK